MSDEEDDELTKWRKERGIPEEEVQRLFSPELRMLHLLEKFSHRVDKNDEEARRRAEGIERNIEIIVQQQAQFGVDLQQLRETQARSERRWEQTAEGISALLAIAEIHEREINELGQTQAEARARADEQMAENRRQMAETDERLNALINTVERIIIERRNGGEKREESSE
jgi:chromosome segregation ATPase